jgi:hypothetical protein
MTRNSSEVHESRKNFSTSLKEGTSPKKLKKKKLESLAKTVYLTTQQNHVHQGNM